MKMGLLAAKFEVEVVCLEANNVVRSRGEETLDRNWFENDILKYFDNKLLLKLI